MDRLKLIQIIEKELEELKILTDEVSAAEKDNRLVIDIALSKARVLCHEMELLRELSVNNETTTLPEEEEETDSSELGVAEPELEIASPEDNEEDSSTMDFGEPDANDDDLEEEDFDEDDTDEEEDETELEDEELIEFEEDEEDNDEEDVEFETSEEPLGEPAFEEEEIEEEPEPEKVPTPERPVIREIPKPEPAPAPAKTAPTKEPSAKGQSLNETMAENKAGDSTINSGPISSLRAAIGLNDRFLFVREIFGNNTDKYNKVIDHLDKLDTIQQAVDYLKTQLTLQKNDTSMKFVDLLKRRFTK
jgi:hypothetical protein